MTGCESIREMLVAWLDGELEASDAEAVRQHLESCVACAGQLSLFRATQSAVTRALSRTASVPADERDAGFAALLRETQLDDPAPVRLASRSGSRETASRARRKAATPWRVRAVLSGALAAGLAAALFWYASPSVVPKAKTVPASSESVASSTSPAGGATRVARDGAGSGHGTNGAPGRSNVVTVDAPVDEDAAKRDLQVPDELRRRPGFFLDYPIVHRLEKLRRLEATNLAPDSATNGDAG